MTDDPVTPFATFVGERRPALLRTALLLTGDRASAETLVQQALARARRRWGRRGAGDDPHTAVLQSMVAAVTRRGAGLLRAEQVLESGSAAAPAWQHRELARALRELPPRTRAVAVLRWHEDRDVAAIARLLGCSPDSVAADAADALRRLAAALPVGYQRDAGEAGDEDRVGQALARLAADPGPWQLDDAEAVADVAARRRTARRRVVAGVLAAACAVGVGVPLARTLPDPAPPPATPAAPGPSLDRPPPIAPRSTPVLTGPTRGSLAGDPVFLDSVRQVDWGGLTPPPPHRRQVVYAGDTPAGRAVLVTGVVDEDFRGVWLTGPVGAAAEALVASLPVDLGLDRPASLVVGGPGPASLLVVAARDDRIEVSDRLRIGPRGTVGRTYEAVDAPDGVAVVPVVTTARGTAVSVRVLAEGEVVHRSGADWPGAGSPGPVPLPAADPLRPATVLPDDGLVATALTTLAVPLGVEPDALEAELVWSGALPDGRPGTVAVLLARSPGGALLVSTWLRAGAQVVPCGVATPPGNADVARLTVARICDVASGPPARAGRGRWLVVSAPPAGVSAEVLDGQGRPVGRVPLTGGGAVVAVPGGARAVRVLDAAGQLVTGAPVAPAAVEPFGDFGSGSGR